MARGQKIKSEHWEKVGKKKEGGKAPQKKG